ncbi:Cytochrome P450 3A1 [Portunus trituberculatus]|uniref:Cytochrome P450 3A1 n=2 Tax=Portunus trituberculatus TaxID=210409 RepID=A0A5B7HYJ6_PORTR|nr:Cytochrome P450 3A1 [Portunus trituberculatus]
MLVAICPRVAELACAAGVQFTSEEFQFFMRVSKHALATRRASHTPRGDFMDMLLEASADSKQGLSDDTLAAQTILFLLAGYDNTANTLAMSLHLLAHHAAVRARLRREVARALLR